MTCKNANPCRYEMSSLNDDVLEELEIDEIEDRYEMQVLGAAMCSPTPDYVQLLVIQSRTP